jgi:uncharacterized protein YkwD
MGVAPAATASSTSCAGADLTSTAANLVQVRAAILCLVNEQRVARGIPALRASVPLTRSAQRHSLDMVRRNYFAHVTPAGIDVRARLARGGIRAKSVGENIGWGMGTESTPLALVTQWMHSAPHRANILRRRYTRTGIGVALGAPGHSGLPQTATFTEAFAGR